MALADAQPDRVRIKVLEASKPADLERAFSLWIAYQKPARILDVHTTESPTGRGDRAPLADRILHMVIVYEIGLPDDTDPKSAT